MLSMRLDEQLEMVDVYWKYSIPTCFGEQLHGDAAKVFKVIEEAGG